MPFDPIVGILFGILALVFVSWFFIIIPELRLFLKQHSKLSGLFSFIFSAKATNSDVAKSYPPVRFVLENVLPLVFWLLILLPMFLFPIILVVGPAMHIPWTTLFPLPP
ncbi:MAG: hypothetical protein JRN20_19850 [Nitrososphaerota archaeon]|nr:hypothetical protein [Nitrososphaerota archaeon]